MRQKDNYPDNYDEIFLARVMSKVVKENGCWLIPTHKSYYIVTYKNKSVRGAKIVYEMTKGKLPPDYVLECMCLKKNCIHPDHWEKHHKNSPENYPFNYDDIFMKRLMEKVTINENGCWLVNQSLDPDGYHITSYKGKSQRCHRIVYELTHGKIPDDLVCDHYHCDTRNCMNPDHMMITTSKENTQRGISYNRNKTHCIKGHEFTEQNTWYEHNGYRHCRKCRYESNKRWRPKRQEWQQKNKDKLHEYYIKQQVKKHE